MTDRLHTTPALQRNADGTCERVEVYVTDLGVYADPMGGAYDTPDCRLIYVGPSAVRGWGELDGDAAELQLQGVTSWSILLPTPVATPDLCQRAAQACAAVPPSAVADWDAEEAAHARWATRLLDPADGQLWSFDFLDWGEAELLWIDRAEHLEDGGAPRSEYWDEIVRCASSPRIDVEVRAAAVVRPKPACAICGSDGGRLHKTGSHYLCIIRKERGLPTPALERDVCPCARCREGGGA